ncbi:alpha/beta hydrolase [Actinokineospora enzanensis]|uniref:alpha/beta hydrolase n=1 Tax=Actinokineospora enzanensis TaxID=155975 RepID=UPI000364941F|nr:alpha/beta hydrolase [Actinokineospora enzanensis]
MPLHPQVRAEIESGTPVPLGADTLAAARADMLAGALSAAGPGTPVAEVSDVDASGTPVRLYLPDPTGVMPVALYLHSGGFVSGSVRTHDAICRYLAVLSGAAIASVDYRLAPEHPFPAALDDITNAVEWLHRNGAERGIDPQRLALVGDSAGGHLATVTARRLRDIRVPVRSQVLVYPVLDPADPPTEVDSPALTPEEMAYCWNAYAPPGIDRDQPDLAPTTADLMGLPPTLVITAEYDILRDAAEAYADRLAEAGVPVACVRYRGVPHSFYRKLARFDAARQAVAQVAATLRAELA